MKQTKETASKSEVQRVRRLGFVDQRGVIQLQAFERLPQERVVFSVTWVQTGIDHWLDGFVTMQRFTGRHFAQGDRIANPAIPDRLETRRDVTDFPRRQFLNRYHARAEDAHFDRFHSYIVGHHLDPLPVSNYTFEHPHIGDDTLVGIIVRVKDQCPEGRVSIPVWWGNHTDNRLKHRIDVFTGLGANRDDIFGRDAGYLLDLFCHIFRRGGRQIDLVDDR